MNITLWGVDVTVGVSPAGVLVTSPPEWAAPINDVLADLRLRDPAPAWSPTGPVVDTMALPGTPAWEDLVAFAVWTLDRAAVVPFPPALTDTLDGAVY